MSDYQAALTQLSTLEAFANVEANLPDPPSNMPQSRPRASGMDPNMWYGLGCVGIWAALDAFKERSGRPIRTALTAQLETVWDELNDLGHLFAHNFAGIADRKYLDNPKRMVVKPNSPYTLTCGLQFGGNDGERINLTVDHFKHYVREAREILQRVAA